MLAELSAESGPSICAETVHGSGEAGGRTSAVELVEMGGERRGDSKSRDEREKRDEELSFPELKLGGR